MRYFLLSVICFLPLASCQSERPPALHEFTGLSMGTSWSVKINAETLPLPRQQLKSQFDAILDRVNGEMSTYLPESELSIINAAHSTGPIPVSRSLMQVLEAAREISRLTRGGFDVTVGPLVNLWGFGPEQDFTVPGEEQIDAALRLAGYEYLRLDPAAPALKKAHGGIQIDLSAIAKGYGVDRVADYLDSLQLNNYLVEIGGEIRARGVNRKQAPWQIGIEQPVAGQRGVQRIIKLDNMAMATSGDYRNFFEQDGIRYSHTIDPRTGRPVTLDLASVTVLHPSAMLADAWATGLLVLGPEQGYATALENGLDAYFIVHHDKVFREKFTPGFEAGIVAE
ncbi:MAG: FAD:protein FMN transferase [Gammaproteobacteria bacterium]|nr:FAD:protein FMN transferase [Gammaproteobacteria bacterium]